jgi:hypothetical protein
LTSFLRKANRQLRQASLVALEALLAKYAAALTQDALTALVPEAAALISDAGANGGGVQTVSSDESLIIDASMLQPKNHKDISMACACHGTWDYPFQQLCQLRMSKGLSQQGKR